MKLFAIESALAVAVSGPVVACAGVLLLAGLALYILTVRPGRSNAYVMNIAASALIALVPTLLIFSFFPDSTAKGTVVGLGLTGAAAFFLGTFVFIHGKGVEAIERETSRAPVASPEIDVSREERYRLTEACELVVRTGDLGAVKDVDVWVSSENANLEPARFYERSVSAFIRYHGAAWDDKGILVDDTIAKDLADKTAGHQRPAFVGTVIPTTPGSLQAKGVKAIYHVVAVQGQPAQGFEPLPNIESCVSKALERLEQDGYESILFPMLGRGTAHGGDEIVGKLVTAAIEHMRGTTATGVTSIAFITRDQRGLELFIETVEAAGLERLGDGGAKQLLALAR